MEKERAVKALKYIIPLLEKYNFKWCISGGFACYLYGVERPIQAIDIDIEADKDDFNFQKLVEEVKPFTTLPFQLWNDKRYDNWVMDVVVNGQLLSICSTANLKLYNKKSGEYEVFYKDGIPDPVWIKFEDLTLPLSPKEYVLKMKQALSYKKPMDRIDISGMKFILNKK